MKPRPFKAVSDYANEVVAFPVVALPKSSEGWGCGIPLFTKCAKNGPPLFVVASACSRFLTGLSARFGMTRFYGGLRCD